MIFMATINYKKVEAEVDALALEYKKITNRAELTHREEDARAKCIGRISELLLGYARVQNQKKGIYKENKDDVNGVELWKIIKRTLEIFTKNDQNTYFKLFCTYYSKRMPTIVDDYLDEDRQSKSNTDTREISISGEENTQNFAEAEAAVQISNDFTNQLSIWDDILEVTRQEALKKGSASVRYMQGYWTIRFIEEQIGKKQAQIWEIYIMLLFFITNEKLYAKHGELMELMAKEFNLKRRAWHNHYTEVFDDICRCLRNRNILKRGHL